MNILEYQVLCTILHIQVSVDPYTSRVYWSPRGEPETHLFLVLILCRSYIQISRNFVCPRDIRKKCLSVITAIFWEVKYDITFSCACAFSQPSERLGALTVRRSCLRESCLSKSKCSTWCLSKSICYTWWLKISKILVQILHAVLNLKVDMSLVLNLKVWY